MLPHDNWRPMFQLLRCFISPVITCCTYVPIAKRPPYRISMLRVVSRVRDFYATSATSLRGCWTVRTVQRRFRPCAGRSSEGIRSAGYVAIFSMLVINWSILWRKLLSTRTCPRLFSQFNFENCQPDQFEGRVGLLICLAAFYLQIPEIQWTLEKTATLLCAVLWYK